MARPQTVDTTQLQQLRTAGRSYNACAEALGCQKATVKYWCDKLGLAGHRDKEASASVAAETQARSLGYPDLVAALVDLAPQHSCPDLAALFAVKYQTMYAWLRRNGIKASVEPQAAPALLPQDAQKRWLVHIAEIAVPAPRQDGRPVMLAPGERWCARCAESLWDVEDGCPRCGCKQSVDPRQVLRVGEYVVLG